MRRRTPPLLNVLHRFLAAGGAALVLALTVFSASPVAHEWLHVDDHAAATETSDDGCAVVMFANGVSSPVAPLELAAPRILERSVSPATAAEVFLVSPRYLRHPERGPPQR